MLKKFTKKFGLRHFVSFALALSVIAAASVNLVFDASAMEITLTEIDEINNENSTKTIKTKQETVEDFLEAHDISLGTHDSISLDSDTPISDNTEIVIKRGMPITIAMDGHIIMCSTTKSTVGEALLETGLYPNEDDLISPAPETPLSENTVINITRVNSENVIITELIENTTVYVDDKDLTTGETKVITKGSKGACEVTVRIIYNNGVEVSREEISRVVTQEPVNTVIANGTKPKATPTPKPTKKPETKSAVKSESKSGTVNGKSYSKKLTMTATGYSAFNSDGSRGKTASGKTAAYGLVAVDKNVIPLGTKLYIEGYGEAIAADTGGAIKGNKIDLCFEMTNAEIRKKFGKKTVEVYILD